MKVHFAQPISIVIEYFLLKDVKNPYYFQISIVVPSHDFQKLYAKSKNYFAFEQVLDIISLKMVLVYVQT